MRVSSTLRWGLTATAVAVCLLATAVARSVCRSQRVAFVASEVEDGNYFAWRQALEWRPLLTVAERERMDGAFMAYARRRTSVSAAGRRWPPDESSLRSACLLGSDLSWTHYSYPAFHEFPVEPFVSATKHDFHP